MRTFRMRTYLDGFLYKGLVNYKSRLRALRVGLAMSDSPHYFSLSAWATTDTT
jgi:hypothetical protein